MKWKRLSSKTVYTNKWMKIVEDRVETEFGKQLTFGVVHKEPFALIIPWDGQHLYLVGQYRYPVNGFSWEFPQGHFEHSSIKETARAELKEETGLNAQKVKEIGHLFLAPGHHSQICHIFLATGLSKGKQELEESEKGMKLQKITLEEFQDMVAHNSISDTPTVAAYGIMVAKHLFKFPKDA